MGKLERNDAEYDRILNEYKAILNNIKQKCVSKYGVKAEKWFGL